MRLVWALACGAAIAIVIALVWAGWATAGTTHDNADAICVAQFMKDPGHQDALKALKDTSSWERALFIEKGGWDKMPRETQANYTVSRACSTGLEMLIK